MKAAHPAGPVFGQLPAAAPGDIVARALGEAGADLETRGIDDAIDLILAAIAAFLFGFWTGCGTDSAPSTENNQGNNTSCSNHFISPF